MTLASAGEMVSGAAAAGDGILAFNAITLEYGEAIVAGAERAGRPVILAVSHNVIRFHGSLHPLAAACRRLAEGANVAVGLHLDHIEDIGLVRMAADVGFSSVMFDASRLDDDANRRATAEAATIAHAEGLWIESELGEVGGKDGLHTPGARTEPAEAAAFVAATGIDALAVAVGTSHAMTQRTASVDLELIARLRGTAGVPLVLHGSSGVSDRGIADAVRAGMVKVNIGTRLSLAWVAAMRQHLDGADPRPALREARTAMMDVTREALEAVVAVDGSLRSTDRPVGGLALG
jgi:fructose-bisphosphate aldolase class II